MQRPGPCSVAAVHAGAFSVTALTLLVVQLRAADGVKDGEKDKKQEKEDKGRALERSRRAEKSATEQRQVALKSLQKIIYEFQTALKDRPDTQEIRKWLQVFVRRFLAQQFKRSCLPDGPKVGSISLSPRGDWRMPSDAQATLWLRWLAE